MSDVWTPPRAQVQDLSLSGDAEAVEIRRQHLAHEASVKAIGLLDYLSAAILIPLGLAQLSAPDGTPLAEPAMLLGFGIVALITGVGLRRLKPWGRTLCGIVSAIGLLGFPFGTLINGYILYLLFSRKGAMVFSDKYRLIIADTPDIKPRISVITWVAVGLLLALIALVIIMFATTPAVVR